MSRANLEYYSQKVSSYSNVIKELVLTNDACLTEEKEKTVLENLKYVNDILGYTLDYILAVEGGYDDSNEDVYSDIVD